MDEAQRLAIGTRIKDLREQSPYKQQAVADKLRIGLRAYQSLEAHGTTRYERCEELAEIFNTDPMWIWDGRGAGETPDLYGANGIGPVEERLDQIEAKVDLLLEFVEGQVAAREEAEADRARGETRPARRRAQDSS